MWKHMRMGQNPQRILKKQRLENYPMAWILETSPGDVQLEHFTMPDPPQPPISVVQICVLDASISASARVDDLNPQLQWLLQEEAALSTLTKADAEAR